MLKNIMPNNSLMFDSLAEFEKMFHKLDLPSSVLMSNKIYMRHPLLNGGEDFMVSYYHNTTGLIKLYSELEEYPEFKKDGSCLITYLISGKTVKYPQSESEIREIYLEVFNKLNRIYIKMLNREIDSILSAL